MSLLIPKHLGDEQVSEERKGLNDHFNKEMERLINKNKGKKKFYILGKLRFPPEFGGKVGRVFLDASDAKPPVVKGTFVYEVDNRSGTKQLLWTCDNQNLNIIPTNKTCPVSPTIGR